MPQKHAARAAPTKGRSIQNALRQMAKKMAKQPTGNGKLMDVSKKYCFFPQIIHLFLGFSILNHPKVAEHTFGTHPEQPLPTGCKPGFLS